MRRDVCRTPAQRVGLDTAKIPIDRECEYGLLGAKRSVQLMDVVI